MRQEGCLERQVILPIGCWLHDEFHKVVTVREFSGLDEQHVSTRDFRTNISKRITEIIYRDVVDIGGVFSKDEDPENGFTRDVIAHMTVPDRSFLMYEIHRTGFGERIHTDCTCEVADCGESWVEDIGFDELEVIRPIDPEFKGEYHVTLPRKIKVAGEWYDNAVLRLPSGTTENKLQSGDIDPDRLKTILSQECVVSVGGHTNVPKEVLAAMPHVNRAFIKDTLEKNTYGYPVDFKVTCPKCRTEQKTRLFIRNFFV